MGGGVTGVVVVAVVNCCVENQICVTALFAVAVVVAVFDFSWL